MGGFLASAGAAELLKMLAVSAGSDILAGLGESIRGKTPYETMMGNQAGYMNQLLPDLANEARGIPSMATRNAMRESGMDINRYQQSYMASMARANPGATKTTAPQRAGTGKFARMKEEANRDILGQAQVGARNQLLGLGQNAQTMVGLAEQRRQLRRDEFNQNISDFLGFHRGLNDPAAKSRLDSIFGLIKQLFGVQQAQSILPSETSSQQWNFTPYNPNET
jgi:hypothetical protein